MPIFHKISSKLRQLRLRKLLIISSFSAIGAAAFLLACLLVCYLIIQPSEQYVLRTNDKAAITATDAKVGIVLGAGITKDGKPFKELQSRLDAAADAYHAGYVHKLILSGDNRFHYYDEPAAMQKYLEITQNIPASALQVDDAGRSTYESCERASKIFQLKKAIIFSAPSHLPRAIYLCRQFGVEAYGLPSSAEANNSTRREILARVKAIINVNFYGERTILGAPIPVK